MALSDELQTEVRRIFRDQWNRRDGTVVPESDDLRLGNDAVLLDATVLYADLAESTRMVDRLDAYLSAEVYKAFLHCAAKLIRGEGGTITAYDGDRVMGVFIGGSKNTSAVRCGLRINWAVRNVVNPALKAQYSSVDFTVKQIVGIDQGDLWVARTGVRGANDLVWVGYAANYAAKLTELDSDYATWITHRVFNSMHDSVKYTDGRSMWDARSWTAMNELSIYRSDWWWS